MKLFVVAILLSVSSAFAQPVKIAESHDGEVWVAYPETLHMLQDGISVMVGQRIPGKNENRVFVGVEAASCARKFGPLYYRMSPDQDWQIFSQIAMQNPTTVGDIIGNTLCEIGKLKSQSKSSRT